jgi:hypothetical protein
VVEADGVRDKVVHEQHVADAAQERGSGLGVDDGRNLVGHAE